MSTTPSTRQRLAKLGKYMSASMAGVVVGQTTLFIVSGPMGRSAAVANLAAATTGAVPNYLINRYWTWNKRGRNHFRKEVLPFWLLTLAGLAVSTVFVTYAQNHFDAQAAIQIAQLLGYGTVWGVKYFVLEHWLFKPEVEDEEPEPVFFS